MRRVRPVLPWVLGLLALVVLPVFLNDFRIGLLTEILIFGLLAASLDLLVGYTGLASLGHATYFGVGGYAAALVATRLTADGLVGLVVAVVATTIVAAATGWLAVRTRGVYFLMLTLAFAQLLFSLALTWTPVTGGSNGLSGIPVIRLAGVGGLGSRTAFYYYALAAFLVAYLVLRRIVVSPFGRALVGIRENEARMRSIGYAPLPYKLGAFVIAGAVGGWAGALFVQMQRFISPSNVSFEISALVLIMVIIGGVGTLYGSVVGAATVLLIRDSLSARFEHWELLLGLVFVCFVYFLPKGVGGVLRTARTRLGSGPPPRSGTPAPDAVQL